MEKVILHKREEIFEDATIGHVIVEGKEYCWTLEDAVRDAKIHGQTAIPYGTYDVAITYSPRFRRDTIQLYNTPDKAVEGNGMRFTGIRVHGGNDIDDTDGCPLVAYKRTGEKTIQGRADKDLLSIVKIWISNGYTVKWKIE